MRLGSWFRTGDDRDNKMYIYSVNDNKLKLIVHNF